jgi:hypothetical protein
MTEPTLKPVATTGPVQAAAARPAAAAGGPDAPRAATGDQLALAARPPAIEADVRLAMRGGTSVVGEGTVKVRRRFLERFILDVLGDKKVFPRLAVGFDPAARRFTGEGVVRWHGIPLPVAITARPVVVGRELGIALGTPSLVLGGWRLPLPAFTDLARGIVLGELRTTRLRAREGDTKGLVLVDPSSILHELGIAPPFVTLDARRTAMTLTLDAAGDVALGLHAPDVPDAAPATPASDVALAADEAAIAAAMREALGGMYELGTLELREGGGRATGQADFKPISDSLTLAKGLLLLAAFAGGDGRLAGSADADPVVVKGRLDVDARVEGRTLVVTPSIGLAAGEMAKLVE